MGMLSDQHIDVRVTEEDIHRSLNQDSEYWSKEYLNELAAEYVAKNRDFSVKPGEITFLQDYASPCWQGAGGVRCLPAVFLPGFAKCGTTDMFLHLTMHRQIQQPAVKEPCWWNMRRINSDKIHLLAEKRSCKNRTCKISMDQYLDQFQSPGGDQLSIDGCTGTLSFSGNLMKDQMRNRSEWTLSPSQRLVEALTDLRLTPPHLIHQYLPEAKYIVMLRDPAERVFSAYLMRNRRPHLFETLRGRQATQEHFHQCVLLALRHYQNCLSTRGDVKFCTYNSGKIVNDFSFPGDGITRSIYVVSISDLLKVADRRNVLFVRFADYRSSRGRVLERVLEFVGVRPDPGLVDRVLLDKSPASNSRELEGSSIRDMWPQTRQLLKRFYRPFNQQLAKLLNDSTFLFDD